MDRKETIVELLQSGAFLVNIRLAIDNFHRQKARQIIV